MCLYVIRPLVRSYGDISHVTRSPVIIRILCCLSLPANVQRMTRPSISTENIPEGNFSLTMPTISIASSFMGLNCDLLCPWDAGDCYGNRNAFCCVFVVFDEVAGVGTVFKPRDYRPLSSLSENYQPRRSLGMDLSELHEGNGRS